MQTYSMKAHILYFHHAQPPTGFYAEYSNYKPLSYQPNLTAYPSYSVPAFANIPYGCNSVDFEVSIRHRIAFVSRGKCNFFTKVKNTFPYQPDAIIIINNEKYNDIPRISYHNCKSIVFDQLEPTKEKANGTLISILSSIVL